MAAIARKPIEAGTDKEMGVKVLRQAIQFIDIAFAVADMDATLRFTKAVDRLSEIIEPANALLLLYGDAGGIDLLLELRCPLEFLPCLEFHSRQSQR